MGIGYNFIKLLAGGFVMGWGPCLAYTAPLLLPYIGGTKIDWRSSFLVSVMFSLGRLFALTILGGLATVAFAYINRFFPPQRSGYLYLFIAFFMVIFGTFIIFGKGFKVQGQKKEKIALLGRENKGIFILGFLMGISPCFPLIAALTYIACVAENLFFLGIFYSLAFGIGTAIAPIILGSLVGMLPEYVFRSNKLRRIFQLSCGFVLGLFGIQLAYSVVFTLF
jgi:sulfite exporter TauE/SafE